MMEFKEKKRWVFFGLPFTFTDYTISEDLITIDTGFLNREENDCYMYKVQDVRLNASLGERIFGLGTITCYTGDVTNSELKIVHVRNAKTIKNFILEQSEIARQKHRTMSMMDIGAEKVDDMDFAEQER